MSEIENDDSQTKENNADEINANAIPTNNGTDGNGKVVILLRAAGGAPILRRRTWELPRAKSIGYIVNFLKNHLKLDNDKQNQLFIYVNQTFAPALDTTIGAVYDCFRSGKSLVLHYSLIPAWG